jgi:hypothetical protein
MIIETIKRFLGLPSEEEKQKRASQSKVILSFDYDGTIAACETSDYHFSDLLNKFGFNHSWGWVASSTERPDYDQDFFCNLIKRAILNEAIEGGEDIFKLYGIEPKEIYAVETVRTLIDQSTNDEIKGNLRSLDDLIHERYEEYCDSPEPFWKHLSFSDRFLYFFLPSPNNFGGGRGFHDLWPEGANRENILEHPAFSTINSDADKEFISSIWERIHPRGLYERAKSDEYPVRFFPLQISEKTLLEIIYATNYWLEINGCDPLDSAELDMLVAQIYEDALHLGTGHFLEKLKKDFGDDVEIIINSKGHLATILGLLEREELHGVVSAISAEHHYSKPQGDEVNLFTVEEALERVDLDQLPQHRCIVDKGRTIEEFANSLDVPLNRISAAHLGDTSGDLPAMEKIFKLFGVNRGFAALVNVEDAFYENLGFIQHRVSAYRAGRKAKVKTTMLEVDVHRAHHTNGYKRLKKSVQEICAGTGQQPFTEIPNAQFTVLTADSITVGKHIALQIEKGRGRAKSCEPISTLTPDFVGYSNGALKALNHMGLNVKQLANKPKSGRTRILSSQGSSRTT